MVLIVVVVFFMISVEEEADEEVEEEAPKDEAAIQVKRSMIVSLALSVSSKFLLLFQCFGVSRNFGFS